MVQINTLADLKLSDFSLTTLKDRYLLPTESSPQEAFARAATAFSDSPEMAQRIYNYVSKGWMMYSSPVLSNGGTDRGMPISCFLNNVDDSIAGILDHYTENGHLTVQGGGIGGYWGNIRSKGAKVRSTGTTPGLIPFIGVVDRQMLAFSQAENRRGSYAAYLPIDHPEIAEFLEMRKPTGGDQNRKCLNLHHAVVIPDSFMELVQKKADNPDIDESELMWDLIDPKTKQVTERVSAVMLWNRILQLRVETGEPYLMFYDNVNKVVPEVHKKLGLNVVQSNLCVAPETLIYVKSGFSYNWIPIENLKDEAVITWNGSEWVSVIVRQTSESAELMTVTFKSGASLTCTKEHKFYVVRDEQVYCVPASTLKLGDVLECWQNPHDKNEYLGDSVVRLSYAQRYDATYCFTDYSKHRGMFNGIVTGNCNEIMLPTTPDRTAVCCLSSVNLETYDEWKNDSMFISDMVRFLDNVLEYFIRHAPDTMSKAKWSASQERSIGLGAMGLHSYFQKHLIPFDSEKARAVNHDIFQHIWEKAVEASEDLGMEKGIAPDYFHAHGMREEDSDIMELNPRRNVYLMAIAPNASSSILADTSPSIEPIVANIYNHKTLSGTFVVKNKYLDKILSKLPKFTYDEVWKSIFKNKGSVQHLKGTGYLTDEEIATFKTAKEISQKALINMAADRQKFIDQGQSVNVFFSLPINGKEFSKLHMRAWKMGMKGLYYARSEEASRAEILDNVERVKIEEELPMRNTSIECVGCD